MIDVSKLTDYDRGRIVKVRGSEASAYDYAVLTHWDRDCIYAVLPGSCPASKGNYYFARHCMLTDRRAEVVYRYRPAGQVEYPVRLPKETVEEQGLEYVGPVWKVPG